MPLCPAHKVLTVHAMKDYEGGDIADGRRRRGVVRPSKMRRIKYFKKVIFSAFKTFYTTDETGKKLST